MNFTPSWKKLGLSSKEEGMKWVLAYIYQRRDKILNASLGSPYKSKTVNNPGDAELYNATFAIHGRVVLLTKKGFEFTDIEL